MSQSYLPILTQSDYVVLEKLRKESSMSFFKNVTRFLVEEMYNYITDNRVWRMSIMGETRVGKSEVGLTFSTLYTRKFNECIKKGLFDDLDVWKYFKKTVIKFDIDKILGSQSDYIYLLRRLEKEKKLNFGQIWQIDESRDKIGGLGSYSEELDLDNLNNIIAKFMQSEIWITPVKFQRRNTPYGLYVYKKDIKNRVNWCLLYKIQMSTRYTQTYHFMGWVRVTLISDDKIRRDYNNKKNQWIEREITGGGDERIRERKNVSALLVKDEMFSQLSPTGRSFVLNKEQHITILEDFIMSGKVQNWNELEKYRIVEEARMIIIKKQFDENKIIIS